MKTFEIKTNITSYDSIDEIDPKFHAIINGSKEITNDAYAPYSNFKVGAALLLEDGQVIKGNNQENAAYPSGLCAERVAMFYANANFPNKKIEAIAISAQNNNGFLKTPAAPCGGCRQVLLESESRFKQNIITFLVGEEFILKINKISDLLPLNFDADKLKT